jgi:hypothetical protein
MFNWRQNEGFVTATDSLLSRNVSTTNARSSADKRFMVRNSVSQIACGLNGTSPTPVVSGTPSLKIVSFLCRTVYMTKDNFSTFLSEDFHKQSHSAASTHVTNFAVAITLCTLHQTTDIHCTAGATL